MQMLFDRFDSKLVIFEHVPLRSNNGDFISHLRYLVEDFILKSNEVFFIGESSNNIIQVVFCRKLLQFVL